MTQVTGHSEVGTGDKGQREFVLSDRRSVAERRVESSQRQLFFGISVLRKDKIAYKIIEEVTIININAREEKFLSPPHGSEKKCQPPSLFGQAKTSFLGKILVAPSRLESIGLSPGWENTTDIFSEQLVDCS